MYNEKISQIIETVKTMPDKEANILEVFLAGFRAGKQVSIRETKEGREIKIEIGC